MAVTQTPKDNEGQILLEEVAPGSFDPNNITPDQATLVGELANLASKQDIPVTLLYRSYDWKIMKINIEQEQTIT